jgi:hypothetical protein
MLTVSSSSTPLPKPKVSSYNHQSPRASVLKTYRLYCLCHALRFNPDLDNGLDIISAGYVTNMEKPIGLQECSKL